MKLGENAAGTWCGGMLAIFLLKSHVIVFTKQDVFSVRLGFLESILVFLNLINLELIKCVLCCLTPNDFLGAIFKEVCEWGSN